MNTGRQREFDYLKGFMMILIFIIHAFNAVYDKIMSGRNESGKDSKKKVQTKNKANKKSE